MSVFIMKYGKFLMKDVAEIP